jgi:hypothetical protein
MVPVQTQENLGVIQNPEEKSQVVEAKAKMETKAKRNPRVVVDLEMVMNPMEKVVGMVQDQENNVSTMILYGTAVKITA